VGRLEGVDAVVGDQSLPGYSTRALQRPATASSSTLLTASTDSMSVAFTTSHDMRRFINAAINECTIDPTFVLDQLGSRDKRGLSRLRDICSYPVSVQVRLLLVLQLPQ
jgi:hypothetical protein